MVSKKKVAGIKESTESSWWLTVLGISGNNYCIREVLNQSEKKKYPRATSKINLRVGCFSMTAEHWTSFSAPS